MRLVFIIAIIALNSINCNGEPQEKPKTRNHVPNEKISSELQRILENVEKMTNEEKLNALTELTYCANNFSLNLYKEIVNGRSENVVLSSFAIFQLMGLISWASTGDTNRQIQKVLNLPQHESRILAGFEEIHRRYEMYSVTWHSSNALLSSYNQSITSDIKNISERIYSVRVPMGIGSGKTMIIWNDGRYGCFIGSQENMDPVTFSDGNVTKTEYKHYVRLTGKYRYGQLPEIQATFVEIPCKQRDWPGIDKSKVRSTRMFILIPNRVSGLDELEKNIARLSVNKLFTGDLHDVNITVPEMYKFNSRMINHDLIGMGLTNMFSENAEISLTALQTKINEFWINDAFGIAKDPTVTIVPGLGNEKIPEVTVDCPFISIITTDDENPLILFMARITSLKNFP